MINLRTGPDLSRVGLPTIPHGRSLTAEDAATRLHAALILSEVQRTYLAPLDQLGLEDTTKRPNEDLRHVCFGNCEIVLLDNHHLLERVPVKALRRFEERYWFQSERLAGFYYLAVSTRESAGPIWQRGPWAIPHQLLGKTLGEIGQIELYEPIYPQPIEDALFAMILCFVKNPLDTPEKPFAVPWVYSLTDDPFSEPPRAPDPSPLSWTIVGPPEDEREVPDRSNYFSFRRDEIERALWERWNRLQAALTRTADDNANFHPLTKHFFVKAFSDQGIDELISQLSCIEATLMLRRQHKGGKRC
jgi:hypothetical protein